MMESFIRNTVLWMSRHDFPSLFLNSIRIKVNGPVYTEIGHKSGCLVYVGLFRV